MAGAGESRDEIPETLMRERIELAEICDELFKLVLRWRDSRVALKFSTGSKGRLSPVPVAKFFGLYRSRFSHWRQFNPRTESEDDGTTAVLIDIFQGRFALLPDGADASLAQGIFEYWIGSFGEEKISKLASRLDKHRDRCVAFDAQRKIADIEKGLIHEEDAAATLGHDAGLEPPPLPWIAELNELTARGEWTCLRVSPGSGSRLASRVLGDGNRNAQIVSLDLGGMERGQTMTDLIEDQCDRVGAGIKIHAQAIARAVAAGKPRVIFVVTGIGQHLSLRDPSSLWARLQELERFRYVENPKVVMCCVALAPWHHLLRAIRANSTGSLPGFSPVRPSSREPLILRDWAARQLSGLEAAPFERLYAMTRGQYGALAAAWAKRGEPLADCETAIRDAHVETGAEIFDALGPCCRDVLQGRSRDSECLQVLREANILTGPDDRLLVDEWRRPWPTPVEAN